MSDTTPLELAHHELMFYTLEHAKHDPSFIHQLAVDATAAQYADKKTKPVTILFALVGLYLHLEKGYTGKEVQQAHMALAQKGKKLPHVDMPLTRGDVTIFDVLKAPPGKERDAMIEAWCVSVWRAWEASHETVRSFVASELGIEA